MIEQVHSEYPSNALELRLRTPSREELSEYYKQLVRFNKRYENPYLCYPDLHLVRYRERDIDKYFGVVNRDLAYIDADTYNELCHDNIVKLNITLDGEFIFKNGVGANDWCIKEATAGEDGYIRHFKKYDDPEDECYKVKGDVRIFYTG